MQARASALVSVAETGTVGLHLTSPIPSGRTGGQLILISLGYSAITKDNPLTIHDIVVECCSGVLIRLFEPFLRVASAGVVALAG